MKRLFCNPALTLFSLAMSFVNPLSANEERASILSKLSTHEGIRLKRGPVPIYSSPEASAAETRFTQTLMANAVRYFETHRQVRTKIDVYAAILSKQDWEGIPIEEEVAPGMVIPVPFGLPGLVDRGPFGAILGVSAPSDVNDDGVDDNELTAANLKVVARLAPARQRAILRAGFSSLEAAAREMPLLVAIHEMGHVYARKLGIAFEQHGSRVIDEMLANLFLYSFLKRPQGRSKYSKLWDEILDGYVTTQCPTHQSMATFDKVFIGVADPSSGGSMLNFLYYQGMAQEMARKLFAQRGLGALSLVKQAVREVGAPNPTAIYEVLARLEPSFRTWYASFDRPSGCR